MKIPDKLWTKIPDRLRKNKALILALVLLTPVFLCGLTLVVYLTVSQRDMLIYGR